MKITIHHYIAALFGVKTAGMYEAQYPGLMLEKQEREDITAYIWINLTAKLYAFSCLGYGLHSVFVKGSWLGMILAGCMAALFYGFRGMPPGSVTLAIIAHINKR